MGSGRSWVVGTVYTLSSFDRRLSAKVPGRSPSLSIWLAAGQPTGHAGLLDVRLARSLGCFTLRRSVNAPAAPSDASAAALSAAARMSRTGSRASPTSPGRGRESFRRGAGVSLS